MASIRKRGNILWIRYYDKVSGKERAFSTKLPPTREGYVEARKMLKQFESKETLNIGFDHFTTSITIQEGLEEFLSIKALKPNTIRLYKLAVNVLIYICGDKKIGGYNQTDYKKLVLGFKKKNLSQNTQGIYTAHLHGLFNYFVECKYIQENFIKTIQRKVKLKETIDDRDLQVILDRLKDHNKQQYNFILFLLITGFRISTAVALDWKNIDWVNGYIITPNVKRSRDFFFPLTNDIRYLLHHIGIKKDGKIFDYSINGLRFFSRVQRRLIEGNIIQKEYSLHQLRKIFITKLLEKGISIHKVRALADHTDIKTTLNYYASVNVKQVGEE